MEHPRYPDGGNMIGSADELPQDGVGGWSSSEGTHLSATDHRVTGRASSSSEVSSDLRTGTPARSGVRRSRLLPFARGIRAWMLVLPVDAILLLLPILWSAAQGRATVAMSLLSVVLLTGGGRYRARLHMSVLDEL